MDNDKIDPTKWQPLIYQIRRKLRPKGQRYKAVDVQI